VGLFSVPFSPSTSPFHRRLGTGWNRPPRGLNLLYLILKWDIWAQDTGLHKKLGSIWEGFWKRERLGRGGVEKENRGLWDLIGYTGLYSVDFCRFVCVYVVSQCRYINSIV
jgi:hypothetical protein